MNFVTESLLKHIVRLGAVAVVAAGTTACSSLPDWTDPTNWIGGQSDNVAESQAQGADNTQTPDLAQVPEKPTSPSTPDEEKQVAESLSADRNQAQYSGDALRGGTEPAAAPPAAEAPEVASEETSSEPAQQPAPPPPPPPPVTSAPGTMPTQAPAASSPEPQVAATDMSVPAPQAAPGPAEQPAVPAARMQVASLPAVPAVPAAPAAVPLPAADNSLGFRPSAAPALDPTVAQFVPQSILSRYAQTASIGPAPAVPSGAYASATDEGQLRHARRHTHRAETGTGGPEKMSGAVVADFDALQGGSTVAPTVTGAPAAVVFFSRNTTILDSQARAQVRAVARAFLAQGDQGFVKVVGHAASRESGLSQERQLIWNFEHSQARANAVARALIQEGVPAGKVLVQAVGDAPAAFTPTLPQGGDGAHAAEIFFQS